MKVNLGCGTDYRDGWVNVDKGDCKCDVRLDIEGPEWSFDDNTVDVVSMSHILEHIERYSFIHVMSEIYRICKNGATVEVVSPYAMSDNFFTDPTHKFPITPRTFDYFDEAKPLYENGKIYGWTDVRIEVVSAELIPCFPNGPNVKFLLRIIK